MMAPSCAPRRSDRPRSVRGTHGAAAVRALAATAGQWVAIERRRARRLRVVVCNVFVRSTAGHPSSAAVESAPWQNQGRADDAADAQGGRRIGCGAQACVLARCACRNTASRTEYRTHHVLTDTRTRCRSARPGASRARQLYAPGGARAGTQTREHEGAAA